MYNLEEAGGGGVPSGISHLSQSLGRLGTVYCAEKCTVKCRVQFKV